MVDAWMDLAIESSGGTVKHCCMEFLLCNHAGLKTVHGCMAQTSPSILLHHRHRHSFTIRSMSKQLVLQGAPVVLQWCYCRGELLWLGAGYGCRGAVLQTEQYSGGGAVSSSIVAGWGCFAAAIRRNCYTLQILAMTTTIV